MNRRTFLKHSLAAGVLPFVPGCGTFGRPEPFYGPTVRDRLWMWGHHIDCVNDSMKKGQTWQGPAVEQAEGCRLMGIPNCCCVRWLGRPAYPWGDYMEQFRNVKRLSFAIAASSAKETVWDMMRVCFEELQPRFPNLTGCFLDDFFSDKRIEQSHDRVVKIADAVHEHGLRLSVVLYADNDGFKPEFQSRLRLCDETSCWFWKSKNIVKMNDDVRRCRDFIGADKDLLLGLYMWDYSLGQPVTGERMAQQLDCAERFLADGTVTGLIFHPTYAAALDVDSVRLSKEWIKAHADDRWAGN